MRLLAVGRMLTHVAKEIGVSRQTIYEWRDSPEGRREFDAARAEFAASTRGARDAAAQLIRANLPLAIQKLVALLDSENEHVVARAAAELADRGGLPRRTTVEATAPPGRTDYSKLSADERAQLRALRAKAQRDGGDA